MFKQLMLLFASVSLFVNGAVLYASSEKLMIGEETLKIIAGDPVFYNGDVQYATGTLTMECSFTNDLDYNSPKTFKLAPFSTYRMEDLIYVKLYHQVINNLEKNNIFVKKAFLDFAEELTPQCDFEYLKSKGFNESIEKMLETAKVLHAIKNGISNEWEKVFNKMNVSDKNSLLLNLIYCFEELGDEKNIQNLLRYMDNLEHDSTIRAPEYLWHSYSFGSYKNWKDQALISLVRLYAAKNDFFSAENYFKAIEQVKNRFIGFREWIKNSKNLKTDGYEGIVTCFNRQFLCDVLYEEDPVNYLFWLPEPEVFYLFLESQLKSKDYNLIPGLDPLLNLRIPSGQYVDLNMIVTYQEAIRNVLNEEYEQAEQINLQSCSYGIRDYDKLVRARLIEEYINRANESFLNPQNEILPESLFNKNNADFFELKLLLMQTYCKKGYWQKALELLKEESKDNYYGISKVHDNDYFSSNHYPIHIDVLKFMIFCMELDNYEEGL